MLEMMFGSEKGRTIMPGVKLGDGAITGAHTVLRRDVPPYAIVAGNLSREKSANGSTKRPHKH